MSPPYVCQRPLAATGDSLGESGSCESKTSPYAHDCRAVAQCDDTAHPEDDHGYGQLLREQRDEGLRTARGKKTLRKHGRERSTISAVVTASPAIVIPAAAATTTTTTTVVPAPAVIAATTATSIAAVAVTTVPARSAIRRCRVRSFRRSTRASKDGAAGQRADTAHGLDCGRHLGLGSPPSPPLIHVVKPAA